MVSSIPMSHSFRRGSLWAAWSENTLWNRWYSFGTFFNSSSFSITCTFLSNMGGVMFSVRLVQLIEGLVFPNQLAPSITSLLLRLLTSRYCLSFQFVTLT